MSTDAFTADQLLTLASSDDRVDFVCDAFEEAWIRGDRPRIEAYLSGFPDPERPHLFLELLLLDLDYRRLNSEQSNAPDYAWRFPEFGEQIEAAILTGDLSAAESGDGAHPTTLAKSGTRRIGHFELVTKIGGGAAGEVWKARDLKLQRTCALKIPHVHGLDDEELHRFLRECRVAAQLRHPNIVSIYDVGRDGGTAYLVADFIDGPNLYQWLSGRRITVRCAVELCATLAEALQHAHEQGVVHRDLKPANIILDREEQPHIADFGLAKWAADSRGMTLHGQLLGTPAYMSPEQARGGAACVDRRADVFALGVILFELLIGRRPFEGEQAVVLEAIIHREVPRLRAINRSIPRDLETICLKALEKDAGRRYATAQEMAVDLRRFMRGESIVARRTGALERSWRWVKRRPTAAVAILLALAAIGSSLAAERFAQENRQLLGIQSVVLTTEPPGARIAFVPRDKRSGELQLDRIVYPAGTSPVEAEMRAGDYFVVAALPDGRFHEVDRHVPDPIEHVPGAYPHRSSIRLSDGRIELPKVRIPEVSVTGGMSLVVGTETFQMGISGSPVLPAHLRQVASFYMDNAEFTCGDFKKWIDRDLPRWYRATPPPSDAQALSANYDLAVACAEETGKRLPTEVEFEFAATNRGRTNYPWGNEFPAVDVDQRRAVDGSPSEFARGGIRSVDRLQVAPDVCGLCSYFAEWTSSWAVPYPPRLLSHKLVTIPEYRVARGGNLATAEGDLQMTPTACDPRQRFEVVRHRRYPGLGFRCVRSAQPLIAYEDFR